MAHRTILPAALLLLLIGLTSAVAADKTEKIHQGLVISVSAEMLVMSDSDGKNEHAHKVDVATAVTIDGKPAKLPELVKGDKVKVAVGQDGKVVSIMAMRSKK